MNAITSKMVPTSLDMDNLKLCMFFTFTFLHVHSIVEIELENVLSDVMCIIVLWK